MNAITTTSIVEKFLRPAGRAVASAALAGTLASCSGAAHAPASSASSSSPSEGAASLAGDIPEDLVMEADLAGMRNDKTLASVMTKAEASGDPDVNALIDRIDRIDMRGGHVGGKMAVVAVFWGRFPKDPSELGIFHAGSPHMLQPAATLDSGVREFSDPKDPDDHLFAVGESAWVIVEGPAVEKVRAHFAKSSDAPAQPHGPLLHLVASASMLSSPEDEDRGPMKGIDHAELTLEPGMSSVKGLLDFKEEDAAKQAQAKVEMLSSLVLAAAASKAKDCTALAKLGAEVKRDGKVVSVSINGIGEAAAAWDPAVCPKLNGGDDEAMAVGPAPPMPTPMPTPKATGAEGKHKKPKKIPAHSK